MEKIYKINGLVIKDDGDGVFKNGIDSIAKDSECQSRGMLSAAPLFECSRLKGMEVSAILDEMGLESLDGVRLENIEQYSSAYRKFADDLKLKPLFEFSFSWFDKGKKDVELSIDVLLRDLIDLGSAASAAGIGTDEKNSLFRNILKNIETVKCVSGWFDWTSMTDLKGSDKDKIFAVNVLSQAGLTERTEDESCEKSALFMFSRAIVNGEF